MALSGKERSAPSRKEAPRSPGARALAGVFVLAVGAWVGTLWNGFVWDDWATIENCEAIRGLGSVLQFFPRRYFREFPEGSYRPMVSLMYMVDYRVWGLRAAGYHLTNLMVHAFGAVGFTAVAWYVLPNPGAALAAGMIFAVHPVLGEAVHGISFREDLLAALFTSVAVLSALGSIEAAGRKRLWFVVSAVCVGLALLSKESAAAAPALVAMAIFVRGRRSGLKRALPLLTVHGAILAFYLVGRASFLKNPAESVPAYPVGGIFGVVLVACRVVRFYFVKYFFPVNLGANYGFEVPWGVDEFSAWGDVLVVVLAVALAIAARRVVPGLALGLAWFAVAWLPVSNVVPVRNVVADRFLYLPAQGLCMAMGALAFGGVSGVANLRVDRHRRRSRWLVVRYVCVALMVVMLAAMTVSRWGVWREDLSLWRDAVLTDPADPTVFTNLGKGYAEKGLLRQAERAFEKAVRLEPSGWDGLFNLGYVHLKQGRAEAAIETFGRAMRMADLIPSERVRNAFLADAHDALGQAFLMKGDLETSEWHLRRAGELCPSCPRPRVNLGRVMAARGWLSEAIALYRAALVLDPAWDEAHYYMARAYSLLGDMAGERDALEGYLDIAPRGEHAAQVRRRLDELLQMTVR